MERSPVIVAMGEGSPWPDKSAAPSDDLSWESMTLPSPSPSPTETETHWKGKGNAQHSTPPLSNSIQTGQLSPVSSNTDLNMDSPSRTTNIHSASSSCTDGWSTGCGDRDDPEDDSQWDQWERTTDEALAAPKLEPMDDDLILHDLKTAPLPSTAQQIQTVSAPGAGQIKQKRPRGRPRKHPLAAVATTAKVAKVAKGRSKTGCITCRKRKKKCDEAKPRCMNCEKNAVVCEGYHEKQVWKSGKERAEEERLRWENLPAITMQPIFHGVETVEDKIFWKHYLNHFSNVLTVEGEAKNAFKDIILQLANRHQGLMHSILAVSSKHMDLSAPYGIKILQENPSTDDEAMRRRGEHHHDEAMRRLYEDMAKPMDKDDPEYKTVLAARYGQMLCLLLQTRAEGNPRGEHRVHLQAYRNLIQHNPPDDPTLHTFITEFFQYHIYADDLLWHPETMTERLASEEWQPAMPIYPPRLMGVADGLFKHLSQITSIRNRIRANVAAAVDPTVDHATLFRASEIDGAIREWTPSWPPGDSRGRLGLLYKQTTWVHLCRTIYPPTPAPARRSTIGSLPVLIAPSMTASGISHRRRASMAAATRPTIKALLPTTQEEPARIGAASPFKHFSPSFSTSSTATMSTTSTSSSSSSSSSSSPSSSSSSSSSSPSPSRSATAKPSTQRRPSPEDHRIILAVDESLAILESFKPSDPAQTLLLIPCLVLGTASFAAPQQQRIRAALKVVRGYTGLRNCDRVLELLEEVWRLMSQGDWAAVWDWQGVARRMGLNFSCA